MQNSRKLIVLHALYRCCIHSIYSEKKCQWWLTLVTLFSNCKRYSDPMSAGSGFPKEVSCIFLECLYIPTNERTMMQRGTPRIKQKQHQTYETLPLVSPYHSMLQETLYGSGAYLLQPIRGVVVQNKTYIQIPTKDFSTKVRFTFPTEMTMHKTIEWPFSTGCKLYPNSRINSWHVKKKSQCLLLYLKSK